MSQAGTRWPSTPLTGAASEAIAAHLRARRHRATPSRACSLGPDFSSSLRCEPDVGEELLSPDARSPQASRSSSTIRWQRRPARPCPGTRGSLEFFIPSGVSSPRHARKPASRGAERSRSALLLSLSPALRPRLSKIKCQDLTLSSFRFRKRVFHGPAGWEEAGQGKQGEMRVINLSGRTHACTETHT